MVRPRRAGPHGGIRRLRHPHLGTQLALLPRRHPRRAHRHALVPQGAGARRQERPSGRPGPLLRGHLLEGCRHGRRLGHESHHRRPPERAQHQELEQHRAAQVHPRHRAGRLHRRRYADGRRHRARTRRRRRTGREPFVN